MSKPEQAKGKKKSPAAKDENLTAEHLPIGAVVETKSGKTGVITHVHKKAGYLFIHNAGLGKTYHVSMASVTKVSGESAADILAKQGKAFLNPNPTVNTDDAFFGHQPLARLTLNTGPKGPGYPAVTALQSHGWKPVKADSMGAVTFAHPKIGGQFHVDVDGTLINANSGTEIKPEKAAEYLRGFHANSEKQTEGTAKQKAAEGVKKGISTDYKDYGKGDALVSHDGEDWVVDHAVGVGVYAKQARATRPTS